MMAHKKRGLLVGALVVAAAFFGYCAYHYVYFSVYIAPYNAARDRSFVVRMMDKDHFWLTDNPHFDVFFTFDTASPSQDSKYRGKLITDVLVDHGVPIGFTSYYLKSFYEGVILFLSVDPAQRGKHYGKKLFDHAVNSLWDKGVSVVRLITRTSNHPAIAVYTSAGFTPHQKGEYMYFEKHRKQNS